MTSYRTMQQAAAIGSALLAAMAVGGRAEAAQILLSESAVIGSTGGFGSTYAPGNIFDRKTGPILESFSNGEYWLNSDSGPVNAFITIDLGASHLLGRFDLFNTTNGFGDRGTADFQILAANSVAAAGGPATGMTLGADAITLVSGTLTEPASAQLREAQSFAVVNNGIGYRYLQFRPLSATPGSYTSYAYGLNELRVFDGPASFPATNAVPEPATWAMMIAGFGLVGASARRRRARIAAVSA